MASLDTLPADQRAVLSLVLERGKSYDEIAQMLSIDRTSVRERALAAFDALGPRTQISDLRRALITDYLLGQLPPAVAQETRDRLAANPSERAWARVLASELAPLSIGRTIYTHINNSNPILLEDSAERRTLADHGAEVAADGLELQI